MLTTRQQANQFYKIALKDAEKAGQGVVYELIREIAVKDLWFLLTIVLGRHEMNNRPGIKPDWLFDRCMQVQKEPDSCLDLWAREHYKSTIITFALSIQDILKDPETTIGIFSVKRDLAQDFLKQIKEEFQSNEVLKNSFPDVLYQDPEKESPAWGIDKGIRVKRKSNSREETVEAWGLVGGMPTGKHFKILVYDDVVTEKSVTNFEQLTKAYDMLRLSFSLGSHGGRRRMIGTRYHYNDAWGRVIAAGTATERIYPATDTGKTTGHGVFLSDEMLAEKLRDQGPYIYACQMLQDPKADEVQGFKQEWTRYWTPTHEYWQKMNIYIVVDPAGERKQRKTGSDYTVMWVIGLGEDERYYLVDGLRDRLNVTERADKLFEFVRTYKPVGIGYERYGMQADIAHINYRQDQINFHFEIQELGGAMPKNDRIRMLIPIFSDNRFYLPGFLTKRDHKGAFRDIIKEFIAEEFLPFPVSTYDDMLDCMARILDPQLEAVFPDPDEYIEMVGGYESAGHTTYSKGYDYDPLSA